MSRSWTSELACPSCYRKLVITRETIWKKYFWKIRFCCYCGKTLDAEVWLEKHGDCSYEPSPSVGARGENSE